ncbi:hypothetical protein NLI96_g2525 [Meripilus lineatus]|uniref:Uncharacterized protein n=1 Tax=Meripilus lineatus TaxID=2056292 RepID=A0AAD5VD34_9APHY|nr:hypothetical protein NLI96_g2525 [Physisporinus lineatus]
MELKDGPVLIYNGENPIGRTGPEPLIFGPLPIFALPTSVAPEKWEIEKKDEGYILKFRGIPTGIIDGHLFTVLGESVQPTVWTITYRSHQEGYTIETLGAEKGWVSPEPGVEESNRIAVRPLISTKSLPPLFPGNELFKISPIPRD